MLRDVLVIGIIFIVLFIILYYTKQYTQETFIDDTSVDAINAHDKFIKQTKGKYSAAANVINLVNPSVNLNNNDINAGLTTLVANPSGASYILTPNAPITLPNRIPINIEMAKKCEAAPNTCHAFNDPEFAANCGISFDINGTASDGTPHIGGLYITPDDRQDQETAANNVRQSGSAPYDPYKVFKPTIGTAQRGTFGITKDGCTVVKEKVDCDKKQTFGVPNCTQCYTSRRFSRVGPETGRLPSFLYLSGIGNISINGAITLSNTKLSNEPVKVVIPANAEGQTFMIAVSNPTYIAGCIQGPTPSGVFKLDLLSLIQSDTVTGIKPRITGSTRVNGFKCYTLNPGTGKKSMRLSCLMPFSFLNMYDGDALACENGPIITQAASATFLESDPCFGKDNKPGAYKLACLQTRWVEMGGTQQGSGYPINQALADKIQKDTNGNPLDIDIIIDNLSEIMTKALTGKDKNNRILSIPEWNEASMYATGVPINTPCDGPGGVPPLSRACLNYLYKNKGAGGRIGSTYTMPATYATMKEGFENVMGNIYISPPMTDEIAASLENDDINSVKSKLNIVNILGNINELSNDTRHPFVKYTHGVKIGNRTPGRDDFDVKIPAGYPTKTYDELKAVCEDKGMRLCQSTEICDGKTREVIQPELTTSFPTDNWIAVADKPNEWLSLTTNAQNPGRYCKTHTEVAGSTPGWGSSNAPGSWMRLAKCCAGTANMLGRYIRLEYNHPECLNLAEIAVYADEASSDNRITTETAVTKSSGYSGDVAPSKNFVDGSNGTIVHSSCFDVPWIEVDMGSTTPMFRIVITNRDKNECPVCLPRVLGTKLIIMDNNRNQLYISDPIAIASQTYTWFPPETAVYSDLPLSSGPRPRQTAYGNNGSVSCDRYCGGIGGRPWNGELPESWNGARCAGYAPDIGGCYNTFSRPGAGCVCEPTGTGWK
jgi:hypothetical protein